MKTKRNCYINELIYDTSSEGIIKKVKAFGTGGHITLKKELIGKEVKISVIKEK